MTKIKELEFRWITRDARPEDQEMIAHLQKVRTSLKGGSLRSQELHEKDQLCHRIMNEMRTVQTDMYERCGKGAGARLTQCCRTLTSTTASKAATVRKKAPLSGRSSRGQ